MKPLLKINGTFPFGFEENYVIKLLSKDYNIKRVNKNEDLFIEIVGATPFLSKEFKQAKKKLLVSGENVKYKLNLFKFLQYISKKSYVSFDRLNKILPRFITNINLAPLRPDHLKFVKDISKNKINKAYAIIPNGIKGENILNLPNFFLDGFVQENFNKIINKKEIKKLNKKRFCAILFSNESAYERIKFAKKLSKYKQVDFYGPNSYNNVDNSLISKSWGENILFFSQYKFIIAIENSFEKNCVTERLPCAFLSNTLPIYRGAPNIADYFSTKSFINYEGSYDEMIKKIIHLDKNDKAYLKILNTPSLTKENLKHIEKKENELRDFLKRVIGD